MAIFTLYRSGIPHAAFHFDAEQITFEKRNEADNTWEKSIALTDEAALAFEQLHHINPMDVYRRIPEYRSVFQTDSNEVETSWGANYNKNAENGVWVERCKKYPLDVVLSGEEPVAFISPSRENCNVLVKQGFEDETPVKLWEDPNVSPARYGIRHIGSFMVPVRDGVKLATDVWLPNGEETSYPVIFVRTPYGRMSYEKTYTHFITRGYSVVIQDTRGRQDSEGDWTPMYSEVEDGDDSLNWIAAQPWCNQRIGMIGASYGGYVQWAAAASGNPHLKALVSIVTAGSPFIDIPRKGGAFVSGMLAWAFAMMEKRFKPENMVRSDWDDVLSIRPIKDIPKKVLGLDVPFWQAWMEHPANDDFWIASSWSRGMSNIKAPAMIVSGWFDDNGMGTTEALEAVADYVTEDRKVILGPWMHNANTMRDIQGVRLGNNALRYDLDFYYQQWFDYKLKGLDNEIAQHPAVTYYDTGTFEWKHANHWPPEDAAWTTMYLDCNAEAGAGKSPSTNDGVLRFNKAVHHSQMSYVYDPCNPAPHLIDMSENEIGVPADYREVEQRDDVLVYSTAPLTEPVTITGDVRVKLYASSSAKDTDWIVRLTDVTPEGASIKLADGVLQARFRHGFEKEVLLEPYQIEAYDIRTAKVAHTFKKGHRIRLTVTSSANHFIFPNANTGKDFATDTETVKAAQTIYHSPKYPSRIEIPIIQHQ